MSVIFIIFLSLWGIPYVSMALIDDFKVAWTGITAVAAFYPFAFEQRANNLAKEINQSSTFAPSPRGQCLLLSDSFHSNNATSHRGPGSGITSSDVHPTATATSTATSSSSPSSVWKLQRMHAGSSFFDDWQFFVGSDPTHGNVDYVDQKTALSAGLVSINHDGNAIMGVNTTQTISGNRPSIRITTNYQFTGGLLILDALHAPTGCATWPAFWTNGDDWPNNGEIDIMEGVNNLTVNQASIHTAPGCQISDSEFANGATGTLVGGNICASAESNNGGCGQQATSLLNTYGTGFNQNGGGVYASTN
ncbi:hypothetical protein Clacol_008215 [Clathrus columnatus]|uniref:GH16 domain-containing protein n=1 Tax=Clathrus columnatus TaxID=1419009 RepID=A0AAV5ALI8_9AGAM|nr:hypothetical protein Clacol_008215 [Clathrus columnatus]